MRKLGTHRRDFLLTPDQRREQDRQGRMMRVQGREMREIGISSERFTWSIGGMVEQAKFSGCLAKEQTELLNIVRSRKGGATLPTTDIEGVRCPNVIGYILLGPASFLARTSQQGIRCSLCGFLDHGSPVLSLCAGS